MKTVMLSLYSMYFFVSSLNFVYEKAAVEPWYDWVYIDWGDSENNCVPAKILIFMDIDTEARAEDLSIEQWIHLSNLVDEQKIVTII